MASTRVHEIVNDVLTASTDGTVLDRLCEASANALPVSGAGLALMTNRATAARCAATDGPASTMEDLQHTLGEGPCLDAYRDGQPVLQSDLASTGMSRWPGYAPAALDAGIAATFAFPVHSERSGRRTGPLPRDHRWTSTRQQLGQASDFAAAASALLTRLQDSAPPGQLHPQLADAAESHREIHQPPA